MTEVIITKINKPSPEFKLQMDDLQKSARFHKKWCCIMHWSNRSVRTYTL